MTEQVFHLATKEAVIAYLLMAFIAMLAAVMIRGIVAALAIGKTRQKGKTGGAKPVIVSVTPARDEQGDCGRNCCCSRGGNRGAPACLYWGSKACLWLDVRSQDAVAQLARPSSQSVILHFG